jgi:hypothetical protein
VKLYPIIDKYADHWPVKSMLKLHLKYTSETARRTKDKAAAHRVDRAFGQAVEARRRLRRGNADDGDSEEEGTVANSDK